MQRTLIHTETYKGFEINFYTCPEYDDPVGHFASGDDEQDAEDVRKIQSGEWDWFVACVTASYEGIELAVDYLGACCYVQARDFVGVDGDYFSDMRDTVVSEAQEAIEKMKAKTL